ncbi:PQQ-binding-like beta-propeller repeat protein [Sphingomonas sp.]|uniref:outer membrane protein assembly factor BamB family protein n=1 Tax=Sphingomonas sp. TaxID=28214 RepID=UPI000DB34050|nr:PQQ-binding-like beta-propeller repeat protein [Sphingomonas sp.]PZU06867.1 MAG: acido-empty-quinoprotein group A [Sphingomonas sp.]
MTRRITKSAGWCLVLGAAIAAHANTLDTSLLGKPPVDSWPTFHGDYSGRRFSTLDQINESNVGSLQVAWTSRFSDVGTMRGAPVPVLKGTPLFVNGILYVTLPDLVYALDARTGVRLWTYKWVDKGGHLVGNRGVGMYKNWLYFMGPDNWVICLDSATGKERWRKEIADARKQYFSTSAPIVAGNHVIVGVGGDAMDIRGFLASLDPETGEEQWRFHVTPGPGEPGIETWPDAESAAHGGGGTWLPGTYDPDLKTLYWGTGNANPVYAGQGRMGDNLYTASLVALDVETGKLKWHFQAMPHDTHDYDGTNTPILFSRMIDGRERKLVSYAARSGWFVTVDRETGKPIASRPYMDPLKWVKGQNPKTLEPISDRDNDPKTTGSIGNSNPTNWYNPAYSDQTGLFYLNTVRGMGIYYLYDTSPKPAGYAGGGGGSIGESVRELLAIDPTNVKIVWRHPYPNLNSPGATVGPGLMATAGNLLFTGDDQNNIIVYRARDGKILWHYKALANQSNGPMTYMLDGKQYVVIAAGDTLYSLTLPAAPGAAGGN